MTEAEGALGLWRHHFSTVLRGDCDINSATRENSEPASIDDDGIKIPPPSHKEVRDTIQRLKNNNAAGPDGLPTKLFLSGVISRRDDHVRVGKTRLKRSF